MFSFLIQQAVNLQIRWDILDLPDITFSEMEAFTDIECKNFVA